MMSSYSPQSSQGARPGYFAEVTLALIDIRNTCASGRLSIRNSEKFGLAHLYFHEARLVHVAGDKHGGGEAVLQELLTWSKGSARFDATALVEYNDMTWQQAQVFERWVSFLEMRGRLLGIPEQQLQRLAHSLTIALPGEPVALPEQIEYHEDYSEAAAARQWQRFGSSVRHMTQELAQRVAKTAHDRTQQAVDMAQRAVKQVVVGTEDNSRPANSFNGEREQHIIQSAQKTVHTNEDQASPREIPSLRMRQAEW